MVILEPEEFETRPTHRQRYEIAALGSGAIKQLEYGQRISDGPGSRYNLMHRGRQRCYAIVDCIKVRRGFVEVMV